MKKVTPHLWFDKQAREAAEFYVALVTVVSLEPGNC